MAQVLELAASNPRLVALGKRLRAARKAAGLTQKEAAERTGLHRVTVTRFESGQLDITFTTLASFADAYGVSVASLTDTGTPG